MSGPSRPNTLHNDIFLHSSCPQAMTTNEMVTDSTNGAGPFMILRPNVAVYDESALEQAKSVYIPEKLQNNCDKRW